MARQTRIRALVLAAGEGRRLRPLTHHLPKPLLPVAGISILERTLRQLAEVGCEEAAVNLHHLGGSIREAIGDSVGGMKIRYSEEDRLLGTFGALGPLRDFASGAEAFLVVNGDSLCRWPLSRLLRRHLRSGAAATLLFSRRAAPAEFGGGVRIRGREVLSFRPGGEGGRGERDAVFAGAHVLRPELAARAPDGPADFVSDLYAPLLAEGEHVAAVTTRRRWHDLGTPERYRRGSRDWVRGSVPWRWFRHGWISADAQVAGTAAVKASIVESNVRIGPGARVERSLILPSARVGRGSVVRASIVAHGLEIPPGTTVEARVVTRARAGLPPTPEASVVGGLVYSPLS